MKLRGLSSLTAVVILMVAIPLLINYRKAHTEQSSNDIKSHLTNEDAQSSVPSKLKTIIANNLQKQSQMTERSDFGDASLLVQERFYTENEINNMTEEEFIELVKATELRLPKVSDLKQLPAGALHTTPAPVMQAGKDLGLLKEIIKVHESYERDTVGLYDRCANNITRPIAVRALCLTNLVIIKKKNGEAVNLKQYPAQLVDLTKMITDL
jgi:hypothetical protein